MAKLISLKWIVVICYASLFISYFGFFINQGKKLKKALPYIMITTITCHFFYLLGLSLFVRHLPLSNVFEVMTTYVFIFVVIYFIIERYIRDQALGSIIIFIALILQLIANIFIDIDKGLLDILENLTFFEVHVLTMLLAYSAFTISFIASIMYILLSREIHKKQLGFFFSRLPSLELLDRLSNIAVIIGVLFITTGILLGIYMAFQVWETGWQLDPKLISVFFTWFIYVAFIYFRNYKSWQGKRASILSILGFVWVLISFMIFSTFFPKVHSFI